MIYFKFNNIKSSEYGLVIEDRILYPSSLTNSDNVIDINVYYYNKQDKQSHLECFRNIQKWLDNTGELIISECSDYYYKVIGTEITITERFKNSIKFNIRFNVEQYKYLINQKQFTPIILSEEEEFYYLNNKGDNISYPIFNIDSVGDITISINNREITIKDTNGFFILDSELQDCYNQKQLLNNNVIGDFPYLDIGYNDLILIGDIKSIAVKINSTIY